MPRYDEDRMAAAIRSAVVDVTLREHGGAYQVMSPISPRVRRLINQRLASVAQLKEAAERMTEVVKRMQPAVAQAVAEINQFSIALAEAQEREEQ